MVPVHAFSYNTKMRVLITLVLVTAAYAQTPPAAQTPPTAPAAGRGSLSDVGAIRRYSAENATLPAPAANEKRVVFMGGSITDFWGRRYGQFFPGKP
jgi:hypothetical protein